MSAGAAATALLGSNASLLSKSQLELVDVLLENGQRHIFDKWPARGVNDRLKVELAEQLEHVDG